MNGAIKSLAIVTPFYPPHIGGVERYAQEFARAAAATGVTTSIVTTADVRSAQCDVEDGNIAVLRLPGVNIPVMGSHYPIALSGWAMARQLLNATVVMAHTRFFMTTLLAARIAAAQGRRICVVDHGSGPLRVSPKLLASASLAYERASTQILKRFSARFFAVSRASAEWLTAFGINNAPIVPNGVPARSSIPIRSRQAFENPIVFFAGRLLPEKGVRELVDAAELLMARGCKLHLRIAGDGPLSSYLEARSSTARFLTFLGRLSTREVTAEMERATVFVNPSNYPEGLPTTLLEAGSAALPVISTGRGGSGEVIQDGVTGWLIREGTAEVIADALAAVIAQPAEAVERGAALFRLVQAQYTWPAIVAEFMAYSCLQIPA